MGGRGASSPAGTRVRRRIAVAVAGALAGVLLVLVADRVGGIPLPGTDQRLPGGVILQGVVVGSLNALLAMGLVLLYRAGRFISFAQGQLGSFAAVFGVALSQHVGLPLWLGLLAGVAAGALVAVGSELVVVRRLFGAPRLIMTVATIGLAQLYGAFTLIVPAVLDDNLSSTVTTGFGPRFTVDPVRFDGSTLVTLVTVPLACVALGALLRTDLGASIRAVAENPTRAALLGIRVRRVSTVTWLVAGVLASTTGVLQVLDPSGGFAFGKIDGPAFILRALAAAVIGGMTSLPVTFAAAVGLGVVEQSVLFVSGDAGVRDLVLLVVVLGAMLARRGRFGRAADALSATGFVGTRPVRPVPRDIATLPVVRVIRALGAALVLALLVALPSMLSPSGLDEANFIVLAAMVALSLTVLIGYGGLVSLGQWAIVAIGAAVGSIAVERGLDFGVALLVLTALGALVAVVVGSPALRLQGVFVAVSTFALAVAVSGYLLTRDALQLDEPFLVRPLLFSLFDLTSATAYYEFSLVALLLTVVVVRRLRAAPAGRDLVASRDNPRAAAAFGIDAARAKIGALAVSGGIAGLAGVLLAFQQEQIVPATFSPVVSLDLFVVVVVGGLGSVAGALLGAVYVFGVRFYLGARLQPLATGLGLLVLLMFLPEGLGGLVFRVRDAGVRLLARRRGIALPSASSPADRVAVPPPTAAAQQESALLEVRGLSAGYAGVTVVDGVDLTVRAGAVVALLGTNGAGKSTLLRAISGALAPSNGSVVFDWRDVTGADPWRTVAAGIVHVPGGQGVFPGLTVDEHLRLAAVPLRDRSDVAASRTEALALFPRLGDRLDQLAGTLSGGEQQMLTLAQAMVTRPRLLMIDELSLGLSPKVVGELVAVVERIRDSGTAVVLVEQSVNIALTLADEAVWLEKGRVRFRGSVAELIGRDDLLRSIFLSGTR
jgi:branched-chain amino acid transport system permease protein